MPVRRLMPLQAALATCLLLSCRNAPPPGTPVGVSPSSLPLANLPWEAAEPPIEPPRMPHLAASEPVLRPGEPGLKVYVNSVTHPANSFVLAANRNHTADYFPNQAAKTERIRALRPTWGQAKYMYRIGHSATDGRSEYPDMPGFHFEQQWGRMGPYPYDDPRHAVEEAHDFEAETIHVVNFGTSDPAEAARYVSYLNNPQDPNRLAYPRSTEGARYFEIGNELSFHNIRGHHEHAATEVQYAQRAKLFAQAMRAASPFPIRIGAVASTNSGFTWDGGGREAKLVKNILQIMGDDVDFLTYHGYPAWPLWNGQKFEPRQLMAQNAYTDRLLTNTLLPAIKQYATHPVQLANTEFFTHQYDEPHLARGLFGALYAADNVMLALNHDMVTAVQFSLDHGNHADSAFFIDDDANRVTAIYQFQQMLAKHWGDGQLQIQPQGIPMTKIPLYNGQTFDHPSLAFTASKGYDGRLYLMALNRTPETAISVWIALGLLGSRATAYELAGTNGWQSDPSQTRVTIRPVDLAAPVAFPGASLTILEITP